MKEPETSFLYLIHKTSLKSYYAKLHIPPTFYWVSGSFTFGWFLKLFDTPRIHNIVHDMVHPRQNRYVSELSYWYLSLNTQFQDLFGSNPILCCQFSYVFLCFVLPIFAWTNFTFVDFGLHGAYHLVIFPWIEPVGLYVQGVSNKMIHS